MLQINLFFAADKPFYAADKPFYAADKPQCREAHAVRYSIAVGEMVQMVCSVTAKPPDVLFKWRKSGLPLQLQPSTRKVGAYTVESVLELIPR